VTDFLKDTLPNTARQSDAAPPALLDYQQSWVADESPLKIGEKSRRIGLTWAEASDNVLAAAAQGGSNVFYISATQDMALEYIEACAMWARAFNQAASAIEDTIFKDEDKDIQAYRILFPKSGRRIVGLSSAPRNLRGKQGIIVIDEAAYHQHLAKMLKAALAMLLWGDRVRILSTHDGADNPFAELINEIRAGKRKGSVHRIPFQDAVAAGLYQRVCLRRGIPWTPEGQAEWVKDAYGYYGDDAAEELDVVPSQGGGRYLALSLIEARMSTVTPIVRGRWKVEFSHEPDELREAAVLAWCEENLEEHLAALNKNCAHIFGEDFGRVGDLTCIDVLEEGRDLKRRVRLHVELSKCPYRQQEQILFYIVDRLPRFRSGALDSTGNGQYLAERAMQKYGSTRIAMVSLNNTFYLEFMPKFRAALEDCTLSEIPRDREIRDDLRALRTINGIPKLPNTSTQVEDGPKLQRHGDAAISLFLAHYSATEMAPAPLEFQSTGTKRAGEFSDDGYTRGSALHHDLGFGTVGGSIDTGGF